MKYKYRQGMFDKEIGDYAKAYGSDAGEHYKEGAHFGMRLEHTASTKERRARKRKTR